MSSREVYDSMDNVETKSYKFRDPVVRHVCDEFVKRSDVGYKKYGQTLDTERNTRMKTLQDYLRDVQEELMDAVLYIQTAREELRDLSEEALVQKFNDDEYNGAEI